MSNTSVKLDEIFTVARGGSPRPINSFITDSPDGINWIMIGDTKEGSKYIESAKKRIKKAGVKKSREVFPGDFLLSNSMSFGRPYILKISGCIHDGWLVLSPKSSQISTDYFYHYFGSSVAKRELTKKASGAVVKNLNSEIIKSLRVPIPKLTEQKRIAAILDKADSIGRTRARIIHLLEQFLKSVFLEMFGDPTTNRKHFPVRKFGDVGELDRGKSKHRPRNDPRLLGGTHPLIQTGDIANSGGYVREFKYTYSDLGLQQSKKWPKGTLCITIAANIAKTGILTFDACFPDSVVGFSPNKELVTVEYVQHWLGFLQKALEMNAPLSAQKNINLAILKGLDIPVPNITLQKKFSEIVQKVVQNTEKQVISMNITDDLFSSLSKTFFSSGSLSGHNP